MKQCLRGLLFVFLCSCLGSICLLFKRTSLKNKNIFFIGLSTGVMLAASIWSLLVPAIDQCGNIIEVIVGFTMGVLLFILFEIILFRKNKNVDYVEKMYFALTFHNIPEGMAVGLTYGLGIITGNFINGALIALAIGIQNIPESFAISIPLYNKERNKIKTLIKVVMSAAVEPLFGILGFLMFSTMEKFSSFLLSMAGGTMIYVVISELIPEFGNEKKMYGEIGFIIGFVVMMTLDVLL